MGRFASVLTPSSPAAAAERALLLEPGRNCWRIERAERAALIVDAQNYYRAARQAMLAARSQIQLIGWDVDTRICLDPGADDGAPDCLGPLVSWLVKHRPELHIYILAWNGAAYKFLGRGSTIFRMMGWARHKRIHFKFDAVHPTEASHHQKIVVVDDCLGFCGGIDMTGSRWDTRAHRDADEGRRRPTTGRRYPPWHDSTMAVDGDVARALGDLGRLRWRVCTDENVPPAAMPEVQPWPECVVPAFRKVDIAIARTRGKVEGLEEIREIEALFLDMIALAKRHVFIENQYFASRLIADAVIRRLEEADGPEFVVLAPISSQGWLDEAAMGPARAMLLERVKAADRHGRFRIYTPVTEGGEDIYVHSKVTIIDDAMLRVGSANLNNRSMGLDSECDVLLDAARHPGQAMEAQIAAIRADLLGEHLGVEPALVQSTLGATGSLVETVETLRGGGRSLVPYVPDEPGLAGKQLAGSELLDPESAEQPFEPLSPNKLTGSLTRS
jgi:phosphatidylserine/phosphatidylglycerophosphate/cardiolipin synthase-like enzyme